MGTKYSNAADYGGISFKTPNSASWELLKLELAAAS